MSLNPKISIVTVAFNDAKNLEETLRRNITQTYQNKEILVIDGGSSDGSTGIIEKYHSDIDYAVSEPDKGIYDAMNKGIRAATGDWIIFMNAGDWFFDEEVLDIVFTKNDFSNVDFIYGNHEVRYDLGFQRIHRADKPLSVLKKKNVFSHQALFSRTDLMKKAPFKIKYRLVADFESFFYHYEAGSRFRYFNSEIASISAGGVSEEEALVAVAERESIIFSYLNQSFYLKFYYKVQKFRLIFGKFLKSILPNKIILMLMKIKYLPEK